MLTNVYKEYIFLNNWIPGTHRPISYSLIVIYDPQIITSTDEDVENWNPHTLLVGMYNDAISLGSTLAVPIIVTQRATISFPHLGIYQEE